MSKGEMQSGGTPYAETDVVVRRFSELTVPQLHGILALRAQVFVVEQDCVYNDIDGRDAEESAQHVWIEEQGVIAAYLRVLESTESPDGAVRVGRVVTNPDHRGRGLAARLMQWALGQHGEIVLDAQAHLLAWYERLGFERSGEEYLEDGIPHVPMRTSHSIE